MSESDDARRLSDLTDAEVNLVMAFASHKVKATLPEGTRYVILAFDQKRLEYIANASNADAIQVMSALAGRLEDGTPVPE